MLTKTKLVIAGIATVSLLAGVAYAAGAEAPTLDGTPGAFHGKFVSFGYDRANGTITDYARVTEDGATRVLFTSIRLASYDAADAKAKVVKDKMIVATDGDLARSVAFDARNAAFGIASPAGNTITLVVPDDVTIEKHAGDPGWSPAGVLLRDGNRTARLVVDKGSSVSVDGQTITVTLGAHGKMGFRVEGHPWEEAKEKLALLKLRHLLASRATSRDA